MDGSSAVDPVCGMTVNSHTAQHQHIHEGRPLYFCSAKCRDKFIAQPARYLRGPAEAVPTIEEDTIYTCPMHPQIRQRGPGSCPICGMALEPELGARESGPTPEL
jgi:Cu+-exporting ATPase